MNNLIDYQLTNNDNFGRKILLTTNCVSATAGNSNNHEQLVSWGTKAKVKENHSFLQFSSFMRSHTSHRKETADFDDSADSEEDEIAPFAAESSVTSVPLKSHHASHVLTCFKNIMHHDNVLNYVIAIPGRMIREEFRAYLELLQSLRRIVTVYGIGRVINTDEFPLIDILLENGETMRNVNVMEMHSSTTEDITDLPSSVPFEATVVASKSVLSSVAAEHDDSRLYKLPNFTFTVWGIPSATAASNHNHSPWKKVQTFRYNQENDHLVATIVTPAALTTHANHPMALACPRSGENVEAYTHFVVGCEQPSFLFRGRLILHEGHDSSHHHYSHHFYHSHYGSKVYRQGPVTIYQRCNGIVRELTTDENGRFQCEVTLGAELTIQIRNPIPSSGLSSWSRHNHETRMTRVHIDAQDLMSMMESLTADEMINWSFQHEFRLANTTISQSSQSASPMYSTANYAKQDKFFTLNVPFVNEYKPIIHDIVIGKFFEHPKLHHILHSNTPSGEALHGFISELHDVNLQGHHPGAVEEVADMVVDNVATIADSAAMINGVTSQAHNQQFAHNKQAWLMGYLPEYVQHQKHVLSGQDPGVSRVQQPRFAICTDHQDQCIVESEVAAGVSAGMQSMSLEASAPTSVFHALTSTVSNHGNTTVSYQYNQSMVKQELSNHNVPVSNIESYVKNVYQQCDTTHKTVVRAYTGDWIYRELNAVIRQHGTSSDGTGLPKFEQTANALSAALRNLPLELRGTSSHGQLVLYRGQSFTGDANYAPGEEVIWHAFSSTTTNRNVAEAFAGSGYIFEIYGVTKDICASVSKFSMYPNEEEILLNRGTKFLVEHVSSSSYPKVLRLRVIPNDGSTNPTSPPSVPIPSPAPVQVTNNDGRSAISTSCQCRLCQFESHIGGISNTLCNEAKAMEMLQDSSFVSFVMNKTKNTFSTRVPYFCQSPSSKIHLTDVNKRRPWLYLACRNNLPQVVRQLLTLGANALDVIDVGSTALHAAAFYSNRECVRVLLNSIPPTTRRTLVNMKNKMGGGSGATAADEASDSDIRGMIREHM